MSPASGGTTRGNYGRPWRSIGWSGAYLLVSRLAGLAAIPILFSALGADLYAAWVLAGSLVMAQGLADLGMSAALVRFVSETSAQGFGDGARSAAVRGFLFFAGLGVAGAVCLSVYAEEIAAAASFEPRTTDASVLIRYAAGAFLLTNITMSLAAILQGLNRVDISFQGQTLSWLVYVPALAAATEFVSPVHGAGLAWLATYGLQLLLLLLPSVRGLRALPQGRGAVPRMRDMISFGGQWQVSSWADFATFQLPRILGAFLLTSSAVVTVDIALRFGQAAVAPLFAIFPILLPAFSRIRIRGGWIGLRDTLQRWYTRGLGYVLLSVAVVVPLSAPAIATWIGRPIADIDIVVSTTVLLGLAAHASTGLFSNAWLAVGRLRPVIVYKTRQLSLAAIFVTAGALVGARELSVGLATSLIIPAVLFNRFSVAAFQLEALRAQRAFARRIGLAVSCGFGATLLVVSLISSIAPPWLVLVVGCVTALGLWLIGIHLCGLKWRHSSRIPYPISREDVPAARTKP
jgi:O-antigen/teichoic acid export membrane protein